MFSVVDVETTGLDARRENIIEIAVFHVDEKGAQLAFSSLVKPRKQVPSFILAMTGIRQLELESAPSFHEIAKPIYEALSERVFVGHNVRFDYGFVQEEFKRIGFDFESPKTLCTVKLSRELWPGLDSYKLSSVAKRLELDHKRAHRAHADAGVSVEILCSYLKEIEFWNPEKELKKKAIRDLALLRPLLTRQA